MRRLLALALLAPLLVAGCFDGGDPTPGAGEGDAAPAEVAYPPPWWGIGESWTIAFTRADGTRGATTLVNFANGTWDPDHFWLGVQARDQALEHVFFETNPFLGRIHWVLLAPHEKGMHAVMYKWPLREGQRWDGSLFGREWRGVTATVADDGRIELAGRAADGARIAYDYDPTTRWFRNLHVVDADGRTVLQAEVTDHRERGARGTYHFLRGRDYLDSAGGATGQEHAFQVANEGATSIAFLLDIQASPGSRLEFLDPQGNVFHSETLLAGGTQDKIVEIAKTPPPGSWKLRYVGSVTGEIKVRGILEYKATL